MTHARAALAAEELPDDPTVIKLSRTPTPFELRASAYQVAKRDRVAKVASTAASRAVGGYSVKGLAGRRSDRGNVAVAEAYLRLRLGCNGWLAWTRLNAVCDRDGVFTATDEGLARERPGQPAVPLWRVKAGLRRLREAGLVETVRAQAPHYLPCGRVGAAKRAELDAKLLRWAGAHAWQPPLHVELPDHAFVLVCVRRVYGHPAGRVVQRGVLDGGARSCLVPARTAAWLAKASRWGGERKAGRGKRVGRPLGAATVNRGAAARKRRAEGLAVTCLEAGRQVTAAELTASDVDEREFAAARLRILRNRDRMRACGLPPSPIADPKLSEPPKMKRAKRKQDDLGLSEVGPRVTPLGLPLGISSLGERETPSAAEPAVPAARGPSLSESGGGAARSPLPEVDASVLAPFNGAGAPPAISNEEYLRRVIPEAWPDKHVVGEVKLPPPPVLDPLAPLGRRCEQVARAYRNAVEDRFPERGKCWILARGDVTRSKLFPLLKAAVDFLTREKVAPAAWAEWSITAWNKIRAKDGKPPVPPPIGFVFSPARMVKHERWFAGTAPEMWKGKDMTGPLARAVVSKFMRATEDAQRTGRVREVMDHYFPDGYAVECARALEESRARAERLRELAARGVFLWGDRFTLEMPVKR